jgi:hypothetical protein
LAGFCRSSEPEESYVLSFPSYQQQWVRETFQRNVVQMEVLKKLMKSQQWMD